MFIDLCSLFFFFFKQKTAYEMRISDWSSDVCSSDLPFKGDVETAERDTVAGSGRDQRLSGVCRIGRHTQNGDRDAEVRQDHAPDVQQIGRASCRERVCQYV